MNPIWPHKASTHSSQRCWHGRVPDSMSRTQKHSLDDAVTAPADFLRTRATLTVTQAAAVIGVGRGTAYEQARRFIATKGSQGIPAIRVGGRLLVPTRPLMAVLGMLDGAEESGVALDSRSGSPTGSPRTRESFPSGDRRGGDPPCWEAPRPSSTPRPFGSPSVRTL